MAVEVFNVLISNSNTFIQILVLDHLRVLLTEESLLQLYCLPIGSNELLNLILKAVNAATDLVTVSQCAIELHRSLFKMHNSLFNIFCQQLDSIVELSLFSI